MLGGLALIALGLLVLPLARDLPLLLSRSMSVLALGMGAMQPSLNSLISRRAGAEEQGEVMGVAQSVGSLSRVLGPADRRGRCLPDSAATARFCGARCWSAAALLVGWRLPRGVARRSAAP